MTSVGEQGSTPWDAGHTWVLILAGGEGRRLQALTTNASGIAIPKQFCSLDGGPSLLQEALRRAWMIVPPESTCVAVAAHHRRWWGELSRSIPAQNIVVQPRNCGTAHGILLPLLRILDRDPQASLLVLPSDHYVRNEAVLAEELRFAVADVARRKDGVVLLGFAPEEADPDLGYIVPASEISPGVHNVQEFIEKPSVTTARQLMERGGLWNSFIFAAYGQALLRIFEERCPEIVMEMRALAPPRMDAMLDSHLAALYERLPALDFSRDILERSTSRLQVHRVPPCGWSDLGTPRRVAATLDRGWSASHVGTDESMPACSFLNLAAQRARLQLT